MVLRAVAKGFVIKRMRIYLIMIAD